MLFVFRNDVLRGARAKRKLTQTEVAEMIRDLGGDCLRQTYSDWERGRHAPSGIVTIAALERVLRIRVSALVDFEEVAA